MNFVHSIKKYLCSILAASFVLGFVKLPTEFLGESVAQAAWDGYKKNDGAQAIARLVNFNNLDEIEATGGVADSRYATHSYSIYWADHTTLHQQLYPTSFGSSVPRDWTEYTTVTLKMYSSKATGAALKLAFHAGRDEEGKIRYIYQDITIDWTGWKTLSFSINSFTQMRTPDISKMTTFQIAADGQYSIKGNPETELWISDFYISDGAGGFAVDFYGDEKIAKAYEALEGSVAVYAGGVNAVKADGKYPLDYPVEVIDNTVTVPLEFFKDFLSCNITNSGSTYTIKANSTELKLTTDSDDAELNANRITLSITPYIKDGMLYAGGAELAKLLGFDCLNDGRLFVVGTEQTVKALTRPNSLGVNELNEIAAYESYRKNIDAKSLTPEHTEEAKDRWKLSVVGDENTNDLTDPDIKARIDSFNKNAKAAIALLTKNPTESPFGDAVLTSTYDLEDQYVYAANMIYAYSCHGSEYFGNTQLRDDALWAMKWLHEHYYSESGRAAWESSGKLTGLNNWFQWKVDIPVCIINSLMCIRDELTADEIDYYLDYYHTTNIVPTDEGYNYIQTGRLIIGSALLKNDYKRLINISNDILKTFLYVDDNERIASNKAHAFNRPGQIVEKKGSGFFTDGSYVFHTFHAMLGSYGEAHLWAASELMNILIGTPVSINSPAIYNLYDFYLNAVEPSLFGSAMYTNMRGRGCFAYNARIGIRPHTAMFSLALECDDEEVKKEILSRIKTAYIQSAYQAEYIRNLKVNEIKAFREMIADERIPVIEDLSENKVYYNMDRVVHERNDWGMSVSMSSSRIFNYESINNENPEGWYTGDGRTEWMLRSSDLNANVQYWQTMDKYRLPGTTVDTQTREAVSVYQGNEYLSSKSFVGGASLGGKYGVAAMDLESYHSDEPFGVDGGGYGGLNPAHKNDLVAKKGYFFLDDGFVCLGTDINASDNNNAEVLTIVDNMYCTQSETAKVETGGAQPYAIISAKADQNPEPHNSDKNSIDGNYATKWAGNYGEIVFDIGGEATLGFMTMAFQNGSKRTQSVELLVSKDGINWESVFDGKSSGKTDAGEAFDLKNSRARYVKYVNKGNSNGSGWVSLTECSIYSPNSDGSIGFNAPDVYGIDPIYTANGQLSLGVEDLIVSGDEWLNFNNLCGYWFPADNKTANIGELKARWTNKVDSHFELWFSHGINPTNSGYAYGVLPGATKEQTREFVESGRVKILSNDNNLQAIRDERTGITYMIFWKAGSFENITVSEPCILIAHETESGYSLAFSDPTQKLKKATVKIGKPLQTETHDQFASIELSGQTTIVTYDLTISPGRTIECEFSR